MASENPAPQAADIFKRRKIFFILLVCMNVILLFLSWSIPYELPEIANLALNPEGLHKDVLKPRIQAGVRPGLICYAPSGSFYEPFKNWNHWVRANPSYLALPEGKFRHHFTLGSLQTNNPNLFFEAQVTLDTLFPGQGSFGYHLLDNLHETLLVQGEVIHYFQGQVLKDSFKKEGRVFKATHKPSYQLTSTKGTFTLRDSFGIHRTFYAQGENLYALTRQEDHLGNRLDFSYDSNGHLTKVSDAFNAQMEFKWNASGRVHRILTPHGKITAEYDDSSNCTSLQDGSGRATLLARKSPQGPHRISALTLPAGATYHFTYGMGGKLSQLKWQNQSLDITYGTNTQIIQWPPNRIRLELLSPNKIMIQSNNGVSYFNFNSQGRVLSYTRDNKVYQMEYDERNNLTRVKHDSSDKQYFYDSDFNMLYKAVENGKTLFEKTIEKGLVTALVKENVGLVEYSYDENGRPVGIQLEGKEQYDLEYSEEGKIFQVEHSEGMTAQFNWTGNTLLDYFSPFGCHLAFGTDNQGQLGEIIHPNGFSDFLKSNFAKPYTYLAPVLKEDAVTVLREHPEENWVEIRGRNNRNYVYELDNMRRIQRILEEGKEVLRYRYDASGKLTTLSDYLGERAEILLNDIGKPLHFLTSHGNFGKLAYDRQGRVTQTSMDKDLRTYDYDDQGRLDAMDVNAVFHYRFRYGPGNSQQIYSIQYANNTETKYAYDDQDRIARITIQNTEPIRFSYPDGNTREITFPNGMVQFEERDSLNRLTSLVLTDHEDRVVRDCSWVYEDGRFTAGTDQGKRMEIRYDKEGRVTRYALRPYAAIEYEWTPYNEIQSIKFPEDNRSLSYHWDLPAALLRINDSSRSHMIGTMDISGSLSGKKLNFLEVNGKGQIVQDSDTFNFNNFPLITGTNTIHLKGFLTSGSVIENRYQFSVDRKASTIQQLNPHQFPQFEYTNNKPTRLEYSFLRQLSSITHENGSQSIYKYLPHGQLAQSLNNDFMETHVYDLNNRRIETLAPSGSSQGQYIYDPDTGDIIASLMGEKIRFYHTNAFGSVIQISDGQGKTIAEYKYDPYGRRIFRKETRNDNLIGFLGMFQEPESGFYIHPHGRFDPKLLRFYPNLLSPLPTQAGTAFLNSNQGISKQAKSFALETTGFNPPAIPYSISFNRELLWMDLLPTPDTDIALLRQYLAQSSTN